MILLFRFAGHHNTHLFFFKFFLVRFGSLVCFLFSRFSQWYKTLNRTWKTKKPKTKGFITIFVFHSLFIYILPFSNAYLNAKFLSPFDLIFFFWYSNYFDLTPFLAISRTKGPFLIIHLSIFFFHYYENPTFYVIIIFIAIINVEWIK